MFHSAINAPTSKLLHKRPQHTRRIRPHGMNIKMFQKRQVWVPTFTGTIAILIIVAIGLVSLASNLHNFLALNQPIKAHILVVEGWMDSAELDQAAKLAKQVGYQHVITTGGHVKGLPYTGKTATYAELSRNYLITYGNLNPQVVTAVSTPESAQDRTYLSAVMVRLWLEQAQLDNTSIEIASAGVHSRRTKATFRLALKPTMNLGIRAVQPSGYDPNTWWKTSVGAKTVITECISWIWTELFFIAPEHGSHEELWAIKAIQQKNN